MSLRTGFGMLDFESVVMYNQGT